MVPDFVRNRIANRIAGEVVLSENPGEAMKKWRLIFNIQQVQLASFLGFSPSVISDYEGGRRKSPGSQIIRKFVFSLIKIDELKGGEKLEELARTFFPELITKAIIDMDDFAAPIKIRDIAEAVDAQLIWGEESMDNPIYGYTVIDSLEAIKEMSGDEFLRLFGATTQRVLVFTKVRTGRSPMVAIKVRGFRPSAVVLHGPDKVDSLAVELAKAEKIPLMISRKLLVEDVIKGIKSAVAAKGLPKE